MNPLLANIPKKGASNPLLSNIPATGTANPLLANIPKPGTPNPLLSNIAPSNPMLQTPVPSNYGAMGTPAPAVSAPAPMPAPTVSTTNLNSNLSALNAGATEFDSSGNWIMPTNLQPRSVTGLDITTPGNTIDSSYINTSKSMSDVVNAISTNQGGFAANPNEGFKPTTGYQDFLSKYSAAVQYSPEQLSAYKGMQDTNSKISDIQRELQNRRLELSRNGALSPAQVEADMAQYTREANSKIADLQSQNRDYTLSFNALDTARKNTLEAFQIQAPFYKPTEVSPGSQIIDPMTGQVINQGTGVSPTTAISYANQLYQNDLTSGQPRLTPDGQVDSNYYYGLAQQQLSGRNTGITTGMQSPAGMVTDQAPPSLQSAMSYIGDKQYIDAGSLNANQLPIAQAYSARTGIPLLTEKDATKLKEANSVFSTANSIVSQIETLGKKVITAKGLTDVPGQYLSIKFADVLKNNPDASVFKSSLDSFTTNLSRASGQSGTLTDQDLLILKNALPKITDTADIAVQKLNSLRGLFENIKQGKIDAYIGAKQPQVSQGQQTIQTSVGLVNTNW